MLDLVFYLTLKLASFMLDVNGTSFNYRSIYRNTLWLVKNRNYVFRVVTRRLYIRYLAVILSRCILTQPIRLRTDEG